MRLIEFQAGKNTFTSTTSFTKEPLVFKKFMVYCLYNVYKQYKYKDN